ncbi:unnamed protein product [Durusdinium trenchii]|uniref:Uncharacterized protein n=1 Tax=Durusdinium trenchii TaxID=1381693 RepID=A0ABP0KQ34_9DINO
MTCVVTSHSEDSISGLIKRVQKLEAGFVSMGQELTLLREWLTSKSRNHFEPPCRQDAPHRTEALDDALDPGLLLPIVQFSGLPSVYALERASPQVFAALSRLVNPIKASFMKLYICGGCQRSTSLLRGGARPEKMASTVERLDLGAAQSWLSSWEAVAPMPEARSDASAVVLQGYLYICGGQDHWMLAEVNV